MAGYYKDVSEIEAVIDGFESCTTRKEDFTHRSHLTVAAYYLYRSSQVEATQRMRAGLLGFLDRHGVGRAKFHETLTIFWIKIVSANLEQLDQEVSLLEMTNAIIESLSDSRLVFDYYSEDLLRMDESRISWVTPDLKDLDKQR